MRIDAHNRGSRCDAGERLYQGWAPLDPRLELYDSIGAGKGKVWERAIDLEAKTPSRGVRYVAGAVERAARGRVTAAVILSGAYARQVEIR